MSRLGRKPIDRNLLRGYAEQWACLLYGVRDGYPGAYIPRVQASRNRVPLRPRKVNSVNEQARAIPLFARKIRIPKIDEIVPFWPDETRENQIRSRASNPNNRFEYGCISPVRPDSEIWSRLKAAKKAEQIGQVLKRLRGWALGVRTPFLAMTFSGTPLVYDDPKSAAYARTIAKKCLRERTVATWPFLPFLVSSDWARQILKAKQQLWTYPRTDRPKSDDKRIEFFARSFAAITLGKAPATATGRWLAGWHWPKDWYAR